MACCGHDRRADDSPGEVPGPVRRLLSGGPPEMGLAVGDRGFVVPRAVSSIAPPPDPGRSGLRVPGETRHHWSCGRVARLRVEPPCEGEPLGGCRWKAGWRRHGCVVAGVLRTHPRTLGVSLLHQCPRYAA